MTEIWIDQEDRLDEETAKPIYAAAYRSEFDTRPDEAECYVPRYISEDRANVEDFLKTSPGGLLVSCVQITHIYRTEWKEQC